METSKRELPRVPSKEYRYEMVSPEEKELLLKDCHAMRYGATKLVELASDAIKKAEAIHLLPKNFKDTQMLPDHEITASIWITDLAIELSMLRANLREVERYFEEAAEILDKKRR